MADYIKKADVVKLCENYSEYCFYNCNFLGASDFNRLQEDIEQLPTADVVEAVHCADCRNLFVFDNYCSCFGHKVDDKDFCSYGERKDVSKMEITKAGGAE